MANHVKILLVDDNPMVLSLLQGALSPLAKVTTSNDSADALSRRWMIRPICWSATTACLAWTDRNWWKNSRAAPRLPVSP